MATKQKSGGLGRGLGSILPDIDLESVKPVADTISMVPLDKVTSNPFQPRKEFDETALDEVKTRGFVLSGVGFTLTKIELISAQ